MATRLTGEALDQRAVDQAAEHRHDQHKPDTEPRQVQAGGVALLPELLMARRQPGEREDQQPKPGRADARPGADD